jgi:hypothetical protein
VSGRPCGFCIREVLPEIRGMIKEGLVVLLDAKVVEQPDAAAQ